MTSPLKTLFFGVGFTIFLKPCFSQEELEIRFSFKVTKPGNMLENMDPHQLGLIASDRVNIYCKVPDGVSYPNGSVMHLHNDTNITLVRRTHNGGPNEVKFEFPAHDKRLLMNVACRLERNTTNDKNPVSRYLSIQFVPCSDEDQACQNTTDCDDGNVDNKYCFYSKPGINQDSKSNIRDCARLENETMCDTKGKKQHKYCPVDKLGMCAATVRDYQRMWFRVSANESCPPITESPLSYKNIPLNIGQLFRLDPTENFVVFKCPAKSSPFYNQSIQIQFQSETKKLAKNQTTNLPYTQPQTCPDEIKISFDESVFKEGADVIYLNITTSVKVGNRIIPAQLISRALVFGTKLEIVNGTKKSDPSCGFTSRVPLIFRIIKWWTRKNLTGEKIAEGPPKYTNPPRSQYSPWVLRINHSDEYRCFATIIYKTCSPHRFYSYSLESQAEFRDPPPRGRVTEDGAISSFKCDRFLWICWSFVMVTIFGRRFLIGMLMITFGDN